MQAQGGSHIFSHATNPVINGGIFTSVINPTNSKVNGFQLLLNNVSEGALHNAAERGDQPGCHPRTRLAIRAEIMQWIQAPRAMRNLILWMYGPAGSGKTAIAQSIAEECERLRILAASFFFWRSAPGRNDTSKFVATIAYQLSRYIPQIEDHLITVIEQDPIIFSRSLSTQMRMLVIEPLKLAAPALSTPMVGIVDGVDECGPNGQSQSDLLQALGSAASELQHLPLVFLVSSRPEYDIREAFNGNHLSSLTKTLVLDNSYKPDKDIKMYFDSTFREIHKKNLRLGCHLPSGWPAENDVNFLISKASGQFIFASTVTKFIDSPHHNPLDQLNIILRLSNTGNETPFAPLDALYRFIFGSVADVGKVLEVLTLLILRGKYLRNLADAENLLGFDIRRALIDMHALLFVPPPTESRDLPRIHHASLPDFLMDRSRSHEYYIDTIQGNVDLCRRCLRLIGPSDLPQVHYWFLVEAFIYHFGKLHSPANQEVVNELARFDLRAALERISNFARDLYETRWDLFMGCVKEQGGGREDVFPRLQKQFAAFILGRLDQYPPSLKPYVPVLISPFYGCSDMFNILLYAVSTSVEELNELRKLDKRLLAISSGDRNRVTNFAHYVLQAAVTAGEYTLDRESYTAFIKTVIRVICARPFERNHRITFCKRNDPLLQDGADPTTQIALWGLDLPWFEDILEQASIGFDLAHLLRERAVQFRNDVEPIAGRREIAKASIEYIKRYGIAFLEHTHQPHTNECAICTLCEGAVVVENIPSITTELPPLPSPMPLSEISDAGIESVLAFADAFETTHYPFTHMLQFSLSLTGTLMISFTGDDSPFAYL